MKLINIIKKKSKKFCRIYNLLFLFFLISIIPVGKLKADTPTPPSAGKILRSTESQVIHPEKPEKTINIPEFNDTPEKQNKTANKAQEKIQVNIFQINGMTIFSETELFKLTIPYIGQELSISEIHNIARLITRHYQQNGYFASYAYVPAQEISDGVIRINVLEGNLGQIEISGDNDISQKTIKNFIQTISPGSILKKDSLLRCLMLLNKLPGANFKAKLSKGKNPGEIDLKLTGNKTKPTSGHLSFDNFGSYYIGDHRIMAGFNYDNLAGRGDRISISLLSAGNGMFHKNFFYDIPMGYNGTRLGLSISHLDYQMRKEYRFLQSEGQTHNISFNLTHPLVINSSSLISGKTSFSYSEIEQKMVDVVSRNDKPIIFQGEISGNRRTGSGLDTFSFSLTKGWNDYSSELYSGKEDEDDEFTILRLNISRLEPVFDNWSLYLAMNSQVSVNNLISSEQLSLGGPDKIRAYPQGEGDGDKGIIGNLELRYKIPGVEKIFPSTNLQTVLFYDTGKVLLNQSHEYNRLSGQGISCNFYNLKHNFSLKLSYSQRVDEAIPIENGPGQKENRFWVQLVNFLNL
jgi:hemolysin activation/secretion protein